ncbi:DNA alkylation repair protein [Maribellus sediminis]|uniref:DNA alkylation repair protein n=1 Tax=Maribellus sediminis TaxID=2696285 RepID=UPI0014309CAA|nr:DNA alkylation repair protein [Maribellus sediminis]
MDFILDNNESEQKYQALLKAIKLRKSGEVADSMNQKGFNYKLNWGVSILDLRDLAKQYTPDHLLALKLWNKQWRETMILATLLDDPKEVTEEQMDFWTKSFENTEIAEQASTNLWVKSKFAFVKALEWCRGKKHIVHFTGIHLLGRLAITDKSAIDEMFEPFFEELPTLAKDKKLFTPLYRTIIALGTRSKLLNEQCCELSKIFQLSESENAIQLGEQLYEELTSEYVQEMLED